MTNALELLKGAATTGTIAGKSPLDLFMDKIDTQIAYAGQVKAGKEISTRSLWFRKQGSEYIVRVGRNAFEIGGSKLFKAADLDKVVELLAAAKMVIQQDKKLQDAIATHSMDRSERLKKGRKAKAK